MGKDLRKKTIMLKAEVVASLPDHEKDAEVAYKIGSSLSITLPANWRMHLPQNGEEVQKVLCKVKIDTSPFTFMEHHVLIVAPKDFPFEKLVKEGIFG